jgi:bis(5'-nucleosyl)-tetraphosphatase (symmetrical)
MSTYAIGDIHGCLVELEALLEKIKFTPGKDKLWFVGDLVNRGPHSLETLRFIHSLSNDVILVLGNHDMHLLALEHNRELLVHFPDLQPIFSAPDCAILLRWLQKQPLLHHDNELGYLMVHAGVPMQWDLTTAKARAKEVENALWGTNSIDFLHHIYGNKPDFWEENLAGWERLRFITNCLTRIRFCNTQGALNLTCNTKVGLQPKEYQPWFSIPERKSQSIKIIFGHWAALEGKTNEPSVYALDTGCVWGNKLTAMRLEDGIFFDVKQKNLKNY